MLDLAAAVGYLQSFLVLADASPQIEASSDMDEDMANILEVQQERHPHNLLHAISYY